MTECVEDCLSVTPKSAKRLVIDKRDDIHLWNEQEDGMSCLYVAVRSGEPYKVALEEYTMPLLTKEYFLCDGCGRRVFKLYLPPGRTEMKCRQCYKLRYRLTTFNPNTTHGQVQYRFNRMDKLSQERMDIRTPIYQGRYTKRFQRFLRMCGRAGLHDVVNNAHAFMATLRAFQPAARI